VLGAWSSPAFRKAGPSVDGPFTGPIMDLNPDILEYVEDATSDRFYRCDHVIGFTGYAGRYNASGDSTFLAREPWNH